MGIIGGIQIGDTKKVASSSKTKSAFENAGKTFGFEKNGLVNRAQVEQFLKTQGKEGEKALKNLPKDVLELSYYNGHGAMQIRNKGENILTVVNNMSAKGTLDVLVENVKKLLKVI